MTLLAVFAASFMLALSGAMAPGPVLAVTIRESSRHGAVAGPLVTLGHAVLEIVLLALIVLGVTRFIQAPLFLGITALVGGCLLILMGAAGLLRLPRAAAPATGSHEHSGHCAARAAVAGALASISNPYWLLWWVTVGVAYLGMALRFGKAGLVSFFAGHILADLAWNSTVAWAVSRGRRIFTPRAHRMLMGFCAVFLIGLGAYFLGTGVLSLLGR